MPRFPRLAPALAAAALLSLAATDSSKAGGAEAHR
jgi:hypothetical protein